MELCTYNAYAIIMPNFLSYCFYSIFPIRKKFFLVISLLRTENRCLIAQI